MFHAIAATVNLDSEALRHAVMARWAYDHEMVFHDGTARLRFGEIVIAPRAQLLYSCCRGWSYVVNTRGHRRSIPRYNSPLLPSNHGRPRSVRRLGVRGRRRVRARPNGGHRNGGQSRPLGLGTCCPDGGQRSTCSLGHRRGSGLLLYIFCPRSNMSGPFRFRCEI